MNNLEYIIEDFKKNQHMDYYVWKNYVLLRDDIDMNVRELLETWKPKIGVYAGSFNPFHLGHYNILTKAEKIFDKIIVARGLNPEKKESTFELPEKIRDRQIIYYEGLLTDMMDKLGYDVTLIRGLRNATDLQYELTQFQFLQEMKPDIKIVNIFCDKEYEYISSSTIRNLVKYGDVYKKYMI